MRNTALIGICALTGPVFCLVLFYVFVGSCEPPERIACLEFSRDGNWLLAGYFNRGLVCVNQHTDECFQLESKPAISLAAGNRGELFACGSRGEVSLWKWGEADAVRRFRVDGTVLSCSFSRNDDCLCVSNGSVVTVFDLQTGERIVEQAGFKDARSVVFLDRQGRVAVADEGRLLLWDVQAKIQPTVVRLAAESIYCLSVSPDGTILAAGTSSGIRILEAETGQETAALDAESGAIFSLSKIRDNGLCASSSGGCSKVWDMKEFKEVAKGCGSIGYVNCVAMNGPVVAFGTGSIDPTVRLWNFNDLVPQTRIVDCGHPVRKLVAWE